MNTQACERLESEMRSLQRHQPMRYRIIADTLAESERQRAEFAGLLADLLAYVDDRYPIPEREDGDDELPPDRARAALARAAAPATTEDT